MKQFAVGGVALLVVSSGALDVSINIVLSIAVLLVFFAFDHMQKKKTLEDKEPTVQKPDVQATQQETLLVQPVQKESVEIQTDEIEEPKVEAAKPPKMESVEIQTDSIPEPEAKIITVIKTPEAVQTESVEIQTDAIPAPEPERITVIEEPEKPEVSEGSMQTTIRLTNENDSQTASTVTAETESQSEPSPVVAEAPSQTEVAQYSEGSVQAVSNFENSDSQTERTEQCEADSQCDVAMQDAQAGSDQPNVVADAENQTTIDMSGNATQTLSAEVMSTASLTISVSSSETSIQTSPSRNLELRNTGSLEIISDPPEPEPPVPQAILHVNSLAIDNGRLAAMSTLSQSAPFDMACSYISFGSDDFVDNKTTNTLLLYPNYVFADSERDTLLGIASSWGFCIGMSDYIVLIVDCDRFPAPRYNTYLHTFFLTLKADPKPLVILHDTRGKASYDESMIKINEILEQLYSVDIVVFHEELTGDKQTDDSMLATQHAQLRQIVNPANFDIGVRFRASLDWMVENMLIVANSKNRELRVRGDIEVCEDSWLAFIPIEPTWKVSIRPAFTITCPDIIGTVSPFEYVVDKALSLSLSLDTRALSDKVVCSVLSDTITVSQFETLSDLLVQHKDKCVFMFSDYAAGNRAQTNHINTIEAEKNFMSALQNSVSNCSLIFYEKPETSLGLALMKHFQAADLNPMMVFHSEATSPEEFQESVYSFSAFLKENTQREAKLAMHNNQNEGVYAFDEANQIIHRLIAPNAPIGWRWYNSILFKLMFDAVQKKGPRGELKSRLEECFKSTTNMLLQIEGAGSADLKVETNIDEFDLFKTTNVHKMTFSIPLAPSWTLNLRPTPQSGSQENENPNIH